MIVDAYRTRVDALAAVWAQWVALGMSLTDEQWSTASRCSGWDVAALYAHVGRFPTALLAPPPIADEGGEPLTAVDILRGFNRPGGVAHAMADQMAALAVAGAAEQDRSGLVAAFAEAGPKAVAVIAEQDPDALVPWPAAGVTTWTEATRIVLMESVVHLLDVLAAVGRPSDLPAAALQDTAGLLAALADPVPLIEAATGRSPEVPFPVLR